MAITGQFDLRPYGFGAKPHEIAKFRVHSTLDGKSHVYRVTMADREFVGHVPKQRSGHRNILHLLAQIIDDIGLDKIGENYSDTDLDGDAPRPMYTLEDDGA